MTEIAIDDMTHEADFPEMASRAVARGLVISGGLFWVAAAFMGPYVYKSISLSGSLSVAVWPLAAALVTIVIGWTYERLAAELMFGSAAAVLVWGVLYAWEIGVWILMVGLLMAPMIISGVLFLVAAHAEVKRVEEAWAAHEDPSAEEPVRGLPLPGTSRS